MAKQELTQEQKEYYEQLRRKFGKWSEEEIKASREKSELKAKQRMDAINAMSDLSVDFPEPRKAQNDSEKDFETSELPF